MWKIRKYLDFPPPGILAWTFYGKKKADVSRSAAFFRWKFPDQRSHEDFDRVAHAIIDHLSQKVQIIHTQFTSCLSQFL